MANYSFLLCFSIAFVFVSASSATVAPQQFFGTLSSNDLRSSNFSSNYTYACDPKRYADLGMDMKQFHFCDSSLPYAVRAKDLVDRLTLTEKAQHLSDPTPGIPRLGLPKYWWWSEALHGVSNIGQTDKPATFFDSVVPGATSFPSPILSTATFNESLWKLLGQVISTEARAMYNLGHAGLTFWSPVINVARDPRWGRILETPGEDPFTVGVYAVNFVRGLQDMEGTENATDLNSRPLKVAGCCKHFAAYDVDNWFGIDRYHFDAIVTEQDMVETFNRPFESCVKDGDVASVMCSYNKVNGVPACADRKLMTDTLRREWDLHGYTVTDCDSIEVIHHSHKWLNDSPEDAVAQVLKAGVDLDCGYYYMNYTVNAVKQGKISEEEVDYSLKNLFVILMRLGFFDGSPKLASLGKSDICSQEHLELAAHTAREGIVLLKNNQTLPLDSSKTRTVAVVGPHANATSVMIGNYAGVPCNYVSPIDGFSRYGEVIYETGCAEVACKNDSFIFPAMNAAKKADATVIVVGLDLSVEAESLDRVDLLLPGYQEQLITQVAAVSKGPVTVVVLSAGGVDISATKNNPNVDAILWAGYPGEQGGRAIADVVFGKYNPGGRLPITWYENNYVDMLPLTSMQLRPKPELGYPGRTYKFYNGSTVFPFGYGLSFTQFKYNLLSARKLIHIKLNRLQHCKDLDYTADTSKPDCPSVSVKDLKCDSELKLKVEVKNAGERDGSHSVMVYAVPPQGIVDAPQKQLIAFDKEFLKAGERKNVKFVINVCKSLFLVDHKGNKVLPEGTYTILVGDEVTFPVGVHFRRLLTSGN